MKRGAALGGLFYTDHSGQVWSTIKTYLEATFTTIVLARRHVS